MRKDCQAVLPIHYMQNQEAETWVGFLNNEEKDAADSVYCGREGFVKLLSLSQIFDV